MPVRVNKSRKKVDCTEIQGEGSFVVIRAPTWEDYEAALQTQNGKPVTDQELGGKIIGRIVESWNWVDDDGNPLPQPTPENVKQLPFPELDFLLRATGLAELDRKNSLMRSGDPSAMEENDPQLRMSTQS